MSKDIAIISLSARRGREFESPHPDQVPILVGGSVSLDPVLWKPLNTKPSDVTFTLVAQFRVGRGVRASSLSQKSGRCFRCTCRMRAGFLPRCDDAAPTSNPRTGLAVAPTLDELVPEDHPVRFVAAFVDGLDRGEWEEMGVCLDGDPLGAPAYHPRALLSVWVYGFMTGVRSTRKLEAACRDQIPYLWLTGWQHPDHNTLWRFLLRGLDNVRAEFVLLATALNLRTLCRVWSSLHPPGPTQRVPILAVPAP